MSDIPRFYWLVLSTVIVTNIGLSDARADQDLSPTTPAQQTAASKSTGAEKTSGRAHQVTTPDASADESPLPLGTSAPSLPNAVSTEQEPPAGMVVKPYVAEYLVNVRDFEVGTMTVIMEKKDGRWLRNNIAAASGLARMFVDTVLEASEFHIDDEGNVQPLAYHIRESDGDKWIKNHYQPDSTDVRMEFFNIDATGEGLVEQKYSNPDGVVLDETNWTIQAARDYLGGHLPQHYHVAGFSGVRQYDVIFQRDEPCQVGESKYNCVVLKRIRNPQDYILVWLAPELNYIPINFERYKKDSRKFKIELMVASF